METMVQQLPTASYKVVAATRIEQQEISRITVSVSLHHRVMVIPGN